MSTKYLEVLRNFKRIKFMYKFKYDMIVSFFLFTSLSSFSKTNFLVKFLKLKFLQNIEATIHII